MHKVRSWKLKNSYLLILEKIQLRKYLKFSVQKYNFNTDREKNFRPVLFSLSLSPFLLHVVFKKQALKNVRRNLEATVTLANHKNQLSYLVLSKQSLIPQKFRTLAILPHKNSQLFSYPDIKVMLIIGNLLSSLFQTIFEFKSFDKN